MNRLFFSVSLLSLSLAAPALAQVAPASAGDAAQPVESVVITAPTLEDTVPQELAKTGVRVDAITSQAIRNGGYVDVAQSLQQLAPGLFILPKSGPFDYVDISLQGGRTEDVLWLVDGVRINNRLYASTTPLDTLPSSIVDHIDVLEGGQALFYGTSATAGAVDIVTRPFTDTLAGLVSIAGDTNSERHIDGYVSDALGGASGGGRDKFVLFASADKSDGYLAFRPQDYQPSSTHRRRGYAVYTVGAKDQLEVTDQLRFTATYQHTGANLDHALPFRVASDVNKRDEDIATIKLDYLPNDRLNLYLKGYYHNWSTHYDTVYNSTSSPGIQEFLYDKAFWGYRDIGANALAKLQIAKGVEGFLGYDFQSYGGRDEVLVIEQHDEHTHAVFGQIHLTQDLIPNASLAAGFRYNMPSVGQSALIWNVSGQLDLTHDFFIKAELGTNFRLPTAEELYANDPLDERGNPDLKPETSTSVNLSIGGRPTVAGVALHWELIGFGRNVHNLIDFATFDPVTQQGVFGNVPRTVRVRGAEVVLDAQIAPALTVSVNYTYNHAHDDAGQQIDQVPRDLFKAGLDYHPASQPFGMTLTLVHTGQNFITVAGNRLQYGDFTVVDLSGRYFLDPDHRHELSLSLENLFDEAYGRPGRGCADTPADGAYDCSQPYYYVNRGVPRTLRGSYSYRF